VRKGGLERASVTAAGADGPALIGCGYLLQNLGEEEEERERLGDRMNSFAVLLKN